MSECQTVPDGKYNGEILKMSRTQSKAGYDIVEWIVRIMGGPQDGSIITKPYHVKDKAVNFLKKEMAMIGLPFENKAEFDAMAVKAPGIRFAFEAVTRDDGRQSYYVKRLIPPDVGNQTGTAATPEW